MGTIKQWNSILLLPHSGVCFQQAEGLESCWGLFQPGMGCTCSDGSAVVLIAPDVLAMIFDTRQKTYQAYIYDIS